MTCKDCIHNELCEVMHKFGVVDLPYNDETICELFKNKANIIELPCKVGDIVYYLDGTILNESKVHCISFGGRYGTYSQGQIHIYDSDKDNITVKIEQFGKTVFLTKEEAEQKLRNEDNEK